MIYFYYFVLHGNEKNLSLSLRCVWSEILFLKKVKSMNSDLFNQMKVLHKNTALFFLRG